MKITIVVDNNVPISTPSPFIGEHGLSLLIETAGTKILLDAGQSDAVVKNLSLLGIHPNQLDAIVLSHGHYDHAGGLGFILELRDKPIPVYGHPDIFQDRYSLSGGCNRYIGIPSIREKLTTLGAEWHLSAEPMEIAANLLFSGQIPRQTDYETGDKKLVIYGEGGAGCQDEVKDDTSLYYSCPDGLVVIGGCTHSGVVNTVENGFKLTGKTQLKGWIGGTHLGPVSKQQQNKTLDRIEKYAPRFLATGHCTGFAMSAELQRRLGERFIQAFVSQVIQVD